VTVSRQESNVRYAAVENDVTPPPWAINGV
jgi:hypothetical protein